MWLSLVCGVAAVIFGLLFLGTALGWIQPSSRFSIQRRAGYPAWSQGVVGAAGIAIGTVMVITAFG